MSESNDLNRYQRALEAVERRKVFSAASPSSSTALLAFESSVELDYLEYRRLESLPLMRFGLLLSITFYCAFFLVDRLAWGAYQQPWLTIPILYLSSFVNLVLFGLTWLPRMRPHIISLAAVVVTINAFSFSFGSAYSYKMGLMIPPEAPVIQLTYTLFLLNLPFRFAAPVSVVTVGVFVLLHALSGMSDADLFYRSFMMVAAGLVGTLACFITERTQRLAWLRARLLQELSEHDSLTGLYNHRLFYQRGSQLLRQARRDRCGVAVLVIDADHFKQFNDSHGHLAGDEALRRVAAVLGQCARRPLDVAARLGGEEFGLLLFNVTADSAQARAEEVRDAVRGLSLSEGRRITVSIGMVYAPPLQTRTIEALIGAADTQLYRAKEAGRDCVRS